MIESENYQMQRIFLWSHKYLDVISGPILRILHLEKESLFAFCTFLFALFLDIQVKQLCISSFDMKTYFQLKVNA